MYQLKPQKVFINKRVYEDKASVERLNRMMANIECGSVSDFSDDEVEQLIKEEGWEVFLQKRQGEPKPGYSPPMVFNAFNWDFDPAVCPTPSMSRARTLLGDERTLYNTYDAVRQRIDKGCVCQTVHDFHTIRGCVHLCHYCYLSDLVIIMLNLEQWLERLHRFFDHCRHQHLFKYELLSDIHCFEPEYGASEMLIEYFRHKKGRYLLLYSKSANIDHLLDLDHGGKTGMCWTLSPETVTRVLEKGTATTAERIDAARKCAEAGYTVRFKFKPIVPLKNWREQYREMIEQVFANLQPEHINMRVIGYFDAAEFKRVFDPSIFDPECIRAMEESADQMRSSQNRWVGPFPHEVRREMYNFIMDEVARVSGKTSVSICMESERMWDDLGPRLGMTPAKFACNCGPWSVPGLRMYQSVARKQAEYLNG